MSLRQVVADNIRRIARERGLSINELARVAGVSRSGLYRALGCQGGVTLDTLTRIAAGLGVPAHSLLRPVAPTTTGPKRR